MKKLHNEIIQHIKEKPSDNISVGICSTSCARDIIEKPYLSHPRQVSKNNYYYHCILFTNKDAIELISKLKKFNIKFYIDIEKKCEGFDWKLIAKSFKEKIEFSYIQPNYITVKGTLDMILNYQPNSILLLGNGNIAKELALRLKLIDQEFKWTHPNNRTHSKNFYIMKTYFKSEYIDSLDNNFDCIINTIPKDNKINLEKIVNFKTNFIDVTGKSLDYLNNIKCNKIRFDISLHLINEIKSQQNILKNKLSVGRRKFKNIYICSGGYIGNFNDFVVDNYLKPSYLIGIADGKGGFLKRINKKISVFKFNV